MSTFTEEVCTLTPALHASATICCFIRREGRTVHKKGRGTLTVFSDTCGYSLLHPNSASCTSINGTCNVESVNPTSKLFLLCYTKTCRSTLHFEWIFYVLVHWITQIFCVSYTSLYAIKRKSHLVCRYRSYQKSSQQQVHMLIKILIFTCKL